MTRPRCLLQLLQQICPTPWAGCWECRPLPGAGHCHDRGGYAWQASWRKSPGGGLVQGLGAWQKQLQRRHCPWSLGRAAQGPNAWGMRATHTVTAPPCLAASLGPGPQEQLGAPDGLGLAPLISRVHPSLRPPPICQARAGHGQAPQRPCPARAGVLRPEPAFLPGAGGTVEILLSALAWGRSSRPQEGRGPLLSSKASGIPPCPSCACHCPGAPGHLCPTLGQAGNKADSRCPPWSRRHRIQTKNTE